MRRVTVVVVLSLMSATIIGCAQQPARTEGAPASQVEPEKSGHSLGHQVLLYVPNRVLDLFDIARLRARVGPGLGVGVRATKVVSAYLGSYASIYAGLPGPRQGPTIKSPVGLESYSGVDVSVADVTISGSIGPDYSFTEFGVSLHLLLLGLDFGLDPAEVLDFVSGLVLIDIRADDL